MADFTITELDIQVLYLLAKLPYPNSIMRKF
jgi:hypothetical protein